MESNWKSRKVVIVGAGSVGSTFAYALAQKGLADEISLLDINGEIAEGQVLDLAHGLPYYPPVSIRVGREEDYAEAQVIVLTAGAKQKPGESRLVLLQKNAAIIEETVDRIVAQKSRAVLVIATNPVDVLTYVALKRSGWTRNRVIGSGTVLDSARFRYLLSQRCNVDVSSVHAYILGEHGDSEFAAWSMTNIGGVPIDEYCPFCGKCENWEQERDQIAKQVKESAYHIINYKGATYFAIGMALAYCRHNPAGSEKHADGLHFAERGIRFARCLPGCALCGRAGRRETGRGSKIAPRRAGCPGEVGRDTAKGVEGVE